MSSTVQLACSPLMTPDAIRTGSRPRTHTGRIRRSHAPGSPARADSRQSAAASSRIFRYACAGDVVRLACLLVLRRRGWPAPSATSTGRRSSGTTRPTSSRPGSACRRRARRPGWCARRADPQRDPARLLDRHVERDVLDRCRRPSISVRATGRPLTTTSTGHLPRLADPGPLEVPVGLLVERALRGSPWPRRTARGRDRRRPGRVTFTVPGPIELQLAARRRPRRGRSTRKSIRWLRPSET